ncbi:MAG: LamG-like jellyroll fold domain-containing protein [Candidatus Omnitrophota bacterium]|nr:LamG-like jellyroll fold domain-containing protein [Candidatus Omnitrophota bacterium]
MKNKIIIFNFLLAIIFSFTISSFAAAAENSDSVVESSTTNPHSSEIIQDLKHSENSSSQLEETATLSSTEEQSNSEQKNLPPEEPSFLLTTGAQPFTSSEKFQVEPSTGTASLTIPIDVPAGRKGIQPSLSLMYNSSSPNGPLGVGWNLELGSIQRSTKKGVPKYDNTDTFVLVQQGSSQELVNIGGNQYRAKIEGAFMKFENNNSSGWLVTDKKGIKYYFGQTSASQQGGGGGTFKWCLDWVEDLNGNYMQISYFKQEGQIYPEHIYYTRKAGTPAYADIEFIYENRTDTNFSYRTGFAVTTSKRLQQITIKVDNNLQRRYQLNYNYSPSTNRSILNSIQQYGADNQSFLPPTSFTYIENGYSFNPGATWINNFQSQYQLDEYPLGDFNGDGLTDISAIFWTGQVEWKVALSNGAGFNSPQNWLTQQWDEAVSDVYAADFNGDGLTDACYPGYRPNGPNTEVRLNIALSTGSNFGNFSLWYSRWVGYGQWVDISKFGDFNGDGLTDVIEFYQQQTNVYLSTGNNFELAGDWYTGFGIAYNIAVLTGDFNGDGITDIGKFDHGTWQVAISTGHSFLPLTNWITGYGENQSIFAMDINNDGLSDAMVFNQNTGRWQVAYSDGTQFKAPVDWINNFGSGLPMPGDFSGDGIVEPAYLSAGELRVAASNGSPNDLLRQISNGIGGRTTINYAPSPHNTSLPFTLQTVLSVTTDDGEDHSYVSRYEYRDGLWDWQDREFRGFGYVKVTDVDGNYSETEFHQDDYKKGRIKEQRSYAAGNSNPYTKMVNDWHIGDDLGGGSRFVRLDSAQNYTYNGDASYKETNTCYYYDNYGNPTFIREFGDVNATGDERLSYTEYVYNTANWLVSLPKTTYIREWDGSPLLKQTWFYYDNQSLDQPPVKGNLTKQEDWLAGVVVNPRTRFTYDEYGNLITAINARGHRTTITYDSTYHLFPLTTTNALEHSVINEYYGVDGVPLDNGNYKGLWGQTKSSQDPNGNFSYSIYDTFGRIVKTISPFDSIEYPTSSIEYLLDSIPLKIISHQREKPEQEGSLDSVSFYDGLGRLIQTKTESEQPDRFIVSGQTEFNSRGLPDKKYLPFFDETYSFSSPVPLSQNPYAPAIISYDPMGRVIQSTNPDGTHSNIIYDDWTTTTIDENGHKQMSYFDAYGRLITKKEFTGTNPSFTLYATTNYTYDILGNLIQTRDNSQNTTTITYDTLGRKIEMTDPDMGHWTYEYDAVGNLKKQTDAKNQVITFQYDELNRLTSKTSPNQPAVNYTYDDVAIPNSKGRLTQATYSQTQGNTKFYYDALGREIKSEKLIDATTHTVERSYDSAGRLTSVKYPDDAVVNYTYNLSGQIEQVKSVSNSDFNTKLLLHNNGADGSTNFLDSSPHDHSVTANGDAQIDTAEYKFGSASALFPGVNGIDNYTKLALHMDGADGSRNFLDSSNSNHSIAANGNSQIDTEQYKFGGSSGLLDGNGDYLTIPDSNDWNLGSADFTIDFWVRFNTWGDGIFHTIVVDQGNADPESYFTTQWQIYMGQNVSGVAGISFEAWDNNNLLIQTYAIITGEIQINTWYHVAIVRNGNNFYNFINGIQKGETVVNTSVVPDYVGPLWIGRGYPLHNLNGRLDELRISKGIARWTSNFTPPSEPYSGSGYLSIPDSDNWNFGSGDFTIDFWVRFNTTPVDDMFIAHTNNFTSLAFYLQMASGGNLRFAYYSGGVTYYKEFPWSPSANTWYHVALVRTGNNLMAFVDGTQIGSTLTITGSIDDSTDLLYIAAFNNSGSPIAFLNGWLDELRISKGIARWTENFSPPTEEYTSSLQNYVSNVDYSPSGQITRIEYGNGVTTDYTYDPNTLRLTQLRTTNSQLQTLQDLSYSYDSAGNILQITDAVNSAHSQTFTYDAQNRLLSANGVYGNKNYSYDEIGNITRKDNLDFLYGAGNAGPHAVTSLSDGTSFSYDTNGNMTSTTNSQLRTTNYEYDFENRLKQVKKNNRLLAKFEYDGDGGRTKKTIYAPCPGQAFLEIPLEKRRYVFEFRSSFLENINTDLNESNTNAHELIRENLCLISENSCSKDYSNSNLKLIQLVSQNTGPLTKGIYELVLAFNDVFSIKQAEALIPVVEQDPFPGGGGGSLPPQTTIYVGSLYEEQYSGLGLQQTTNHIFLGSQRIASIEHQGSSIEHRYYHTNHLGSTDVITDDTGSQLVHYEYDPYGTIALTEGSDVTDYKFTGKPLDDETGLYYYGARYYNPTIGRFITPDTIVQAPYDPQSLNRYSYCRNNPVNYVDPTGHKWSWKKFWHSFAGAFLGAIITVITAGWGAPLWLAGMAGGFFGGALTGGLEGGWQGALYGGLIGGALGGLGGWGLGIAQAHQMAGQYIAGMLIVGAGVAGATDSWDSFAGGLTGGLTGWAAGNGINSLNKPQNGQSNNALNKATTNTNDGSTENALKVDIKKGYDDLKKSEWGETFEGRKVTRVVGRAINKGNVSVEDLPSDTRAAYANGKIKINSQIKQNEIPGRLAHEGTHALQDARGQLKVYDFPDERAAFNAGYAVDNKMGVYGAYNPTNDEIKSSYKNYFDK